MKLTGHKTENVYRRYAIASEADLREGVQKLARLQAAEHTQARTNLPLRHNNGTISGWELFEAEGGRK